MKKTIFLGIFLMLVLSSFALADLSVTSATIGGPNQRRSNPDEDINETIQATFTLTNNGNETVTNLVFDASGIDSKYEIQFINPPTEIDANSSINVTIQGYIPIDLDAVDSKGNKIAVNIGTMNVDGDSVDPVNANVYMEARNMIEIDRADITWNGEDERIDNGETIEDVKPGQDIELVLSIENLFDDSDDEDFDIEDVEASIEIDNEFDVDDDRIDIGDIAPEDKEEVTFNMYVETDADDGTYDLVIEVVGEDENGARHGEKWTVYLEINREKEDIRIKTAEFIPETVSCDRIARLEVTIENFGSRDSDEIALKVENDELDYLQKVVNLDLDSEDDYSRTFTIDIPDDADAGLYLFTVKTYFDSDDYNDNDYNDIKDILITVKDCETTPPAEEEDEEEEEEDGIIIQPQPPVQPTTPTGGVVYGEPVKAADELLTSNVFIAILAVGALIGVALLFLAIAVLVRK